MGSSDSVGLGLGDSGVGSIVWVRRRNGSWWPGKILGPQELSASHLMSPRSGTPVKLLGREDASVDWYNLEKSKRVKAFRCGEFDDCIERAEASLGLPAKKREKYARREDAILHAIELERKFHEKKYGKVVTLKSVKENSSDSERKELVTSPIAVENGEEKLGHHESYQLERKVNISKMIEINVTPHPRAHKASDAACPSVQEHSTESNRRVRRLQEFGLRTLPINGTNYPSAAFDDSNTMAIGGHPCADSTVDPCFQNSSDSDSRNSIGKGKRLVEGFAEECLPKRHGRNHVGFHDNYLQPDSDFISMNGKERTGNGEHQAVYFPTEPSKVFDTNHDSQGQMKTSVSRLEVGSGRPLHDTVAEESTSGSSEETESDSSETHSLGREVDAGMIHSDAETHSRPQPSSLKRLEMQDGHESTSSAESDELSIDDRLQFYPHGPSPPAVGVSKWQLKGKRNIRNFSRRPKDVFAHRTYVEGRGKSLNQSVPSYSLGSYYHDNDYSNQVDFIEDDFNPNTCRFGKREHFPSRAATQRQNSVGQNIIDWDDLAWGKPIREYWEDRGGCFDPTYDGQNGHGMLIDVDLKVQANRQGEHVPWVSLMSRLNGKAIIGHPIQIEALEEGSTDNLVLSSDVYGNLKYDSDRNRVPPVWSTARRTANFRVPHHRLSSQQGCDEDAYDGQCFHQQPGKVRYKKSLASSSFRKGSLTKKTHQLKGVKKATKRVNTSSNQKTKALSSIGYDPKFSSNKRKNNHTNYYMDGVLKPVDSGPPAVACIPVKLVFSRLLEAVGRPPSGPAKHGGVSVNNYN